MFNKKSKKILKSLIVYLFDERENKEVNFKKYIIPDGGHVTISTISGDLLIYDGDGDIKHHIRWQAGFSQKYEYVY